MRVASALIPVMVLVAAPPVGAMSVGGDRTHSLRDLITSSDLVAVIAVVERPRHGEPMAVAVRETFKGPLTGSTLTIVGERGGALHEGARVLVFLAAQGEGTYARLPGSPAVSVAGDTVDIEYSIDALGSADAQWVKESLPRAAFLSMVAATARVSGGDALADIAPRQSVSLADLGLGKDCGPKLGREFMTPRDPSVCMREAFASCEPAFMVFMDFVPGCNAGTEPGRTLFVVTPRDGGCVMSVIGTIDDADHIVTECSVMLDRDKPERNFRAELAGCNVVKHITAARAPLSACEDRARPLERLIAFMTGAQPAPVSAARCRPVP